MLYYFTSGSYSDYSVMSVWEGPDLKEGEDRKLVQEYLSSLTGLVGSDQRRIATSDGGTRWVGNDEVIEWLEKKGFKKVEAQEFMVDY
jgi:hypothetical protein